MRTHSNIFRFTKNTFQNGQWVERGNGSNGTLATLPKSMLAIRSRAMFAKNVTIDMQIFN